MNPLSSLVHEAAALLRVPAIAAYSIAQVLLVAYAAHRYLTLARCLTRRDVARPEAPDVWPRVTVQLPVFNERRVVERLIAAAAALDYPRDRLELQVLDDSTDDTRERVDRAAATARAAGTRVEVVRRAERDGYKAGALAAGLEQARGELLAVFDADFVPQPDFLRRMVPHFSDPAVGMAQARWSHLNRDRSLLTRAQAVMLDAHFRLEHRARAARGLFFNFNGSAGIWRRSCIESAGGWSSDTLTEDLDLSYRAQLAGWRFVYDDSVEVPGELPSEIGAFRIQQHRWAKGSIQTARRVLPALWRSPLPWAVRAEAFVHLTCNVAYPLLVLLAICLVPVLFATEGVAPRLAVALQVGILLAGLLPVTSFLALGQRGSGRRVGHIARDVVAALVVGAGLAPNNARAVIAALGPRIGDWERTPKTGEGALPGEGPAYRPARRETGLPELALALYLATTLALAPAGLRDRAGPQLLVLVAGFAYVGWRSWRESGWRGGRLERALSPEIGLPGENSAR